MLVCCQCLHDVDVQMHRATSLNTVQADGSLTRWLEKKPGNPARLLVTYQITVHKHPSATKCDHWAAPLMDTAIVLKGTERMAEAVCPCHVPLQCDLAVTLRV
jgi:hypothetical protein